MAEKASAGEEPFVYDSELKRMKLMYEMNLSDSDGKSQNGCLPFVAVGPHGRAGVNVIADTVDTLTYVTSVWRVSGEILN